MRVLGNWRHKMCDGLGFVQVGLGLLWSERRLFRRSSFQKQKVWRKSRVLVLVMGHVQCLNAFCAAILAMATRLKISSICGLQILRSEVSLKLI